MTELPTFIHRLRTFRPAVSLIIAAIVLLPARVGAREAVTAHGPMDLPLAVQATIAGMLASRDATFSARETRPGVMELKSAEHGLTAEIHGRGVTMSHADLRWRLTLARWGRAGALRPAAPGRAAAAANRVEVERDGLVEWYVNGHLGIEQGFTLYGAPSPADGRPLVLELTSGGPVRLETTADERTLEVVDEVGGTRFRYAGLTALDADGRELPVAMRTATGVLRIEVDDRDARYPVVIDPLVQTARYGAVKAIDNLRLGNDVAIDGDTLVVGVRDQPAVGPPLFRLGAVYVFVRTGATWASAKPTAVLQAPEGAYGFGTAVAIDDDTIVVGALETSGFGGVGGPGAGGIAYVYERSPGGWTDAPPVAALTASDRDLFDNHAQTFGQDVAIDGDTIVVGAPLYDLDQGAVYVFAKPPGGWVSTTETGKLTAAVPVTGEKLGYAVAVSGDAIVAGAPAPQGAMSGNPGSALVFVRPFGGWTSMTETAAIGASDGQPGDRLGWSVAIDDDVIVVGAPGRVDPAVYLWEKPLTGWDSVTETAILTASPSVFGASFGSSVAVRGGRIASGYFDLCLFDEPPGGWVSATESAVLREFDTDVLGRIAWSVALGTNGEVASSSIFANQGSATMVGAAFLFEEIADAIACPLTPSAGCATAVKGRLALKYDDSKPTAGQIQWKFSGGPELHRADFGDPTTTTNYALCVYDDGELAMTKPILGGFGRWALSGSDAYKYADKDKRYAIAGIRGVQFKGGLAGKSAIQIKGKGSGVGGPPASRGGSTVLQAGSEVRVQLLQTGGACYESVLLPAHVRANTWTAGKGRFDANR